jgi:serine/threonine protein kinase
MLQVFRDEADMIGSSFGHYKIVDKLGSGGMGLVYKAEDTNLKRTVALKFLPPDMTRNADAKQRMLHEAQAASALQHDNICTIHEIGETDDGQLFISMALYEGETLKERIAKGTLELGVAKDITRQIGAGLARTHKNEIIHRDIKPANIFITTDGVVKILDFGLAKAKGQTQVTKMGATVGTIDYMSPEQTTGDVVDKRTDIWALGIVLYEMLTGHAPFHADYEQAVVYSILNSDPDLSGIPTEVCPILKKALAKSPDERYQSVEEMLADLDAGPSAGKTRGQVLSNRPGKRSIRTKSIAGTLLLVVIAGIVYLKTSVGSEAVEPQRKMIVVLPFENLGSADDEYFAQGMREEISNKLGSFASLGVISKNSAEKFAKSKKTAKEIGKELGVDYILGGTVQWAKYKDKPSRVRIIPQLIKVSDDVNVWSDSYDRIVNDVFDIQNEIAQNVVDKIGANIFSRKLGGPPPTTNIEAYDYYLKALKFHYGPSTGANIKTCVKLYEKAIELDPNFASAHAQIAIAYMGLFKWYWDRDSLNLQRGAEHLKKAEQLNPNLPDVHLAQFYYHVWYTNDRERVLEELKKTLELQPNNAEACYSIGGYYWNVGETELGRHYDEKVLQLDPLNARYSWGIGSMYRLWRDYGNAEKHLKRAAELSPATSSFFVDLAEMYVDWKGDTKLARQTVEHVKDEEYLEVSHNVFVDLDILERKYDDALIRLKSSDREYENSGYKYTSNAQVIALVYRFRGDKDASKRYFTSAKNGIEALRVNASNDFRFPLALSVCYAGLGQEERALAECEKGTGLMVTAVSDRIENMRHSYLAEIYTLLGEYDNALQQIDWLLSHRSGFSVNRLKLHPLYDPIRTFPAYRALVQKYSSPSVNEEQPNP